MNGQDYLHAARRLETAEGLDPWTALMRILVARLQGMDIPVPLRPALVQAAANWSGHPVDLVGENVKIWQYIEATRPSGADVATPEGRTARALLCVLMPAGNEEARSMTAEWFAEMTQDRSGGG